MIIITIISFPHCAKIIGTAAPISPWDHQGRGRLEGRRRVAISSQNENATITVLTTTNAQLRTGTVGSATLQRPMDKRRIDTAKMMIGAGWRVRLKESPHLRFSHALVT